MLSKLAARVSIKIKEKKERKQMRREVKSCWLHMGMRMRLDFGHINLALLVPEDRVNFSLAQCLEGRSFNHIKKEINVKKQS
ncbi:hypothetical protein EYF80_017297 [Liparis tanakae]|uniref:Uncharacterized protein n=1 Tax=Liparis tanakae TaxID=230148 RepID=A0A4Z2I427_9TELE|nr:hypothetical protein EYF80_017297 [Liparis tanakae]